VQPGWLSVARLSRRRLGNGSPSPPDFGWGFHHIESQKHMTALVKA